MKKKRIVEFYGYSGCVGFRVDESAITRDAKIELQKVLKENKGSKLETVIPDNKLKNNFFLVFDDGD